MTGSELTLLRPAWLLALLPLLLLCLLLWRSRADRAQWRGIVEPHLQGWMLDTGDEHRRGAAPWLLLALGWLLAVIALAGPAWERLPQPVHRKVDARVLVLDLSRSMYARDEQPSRIARARHKLSDVLQRERESQLALIAYAGAAFVVTPFSDDGATILGQLQQLEPDLMPVQGSRTAEALTLAGDLIRRSGIAGARILLVGDGLGPGEDVTELARLAGHPVDILAVGTPAGGPIPLPDGGFLRGPQGEIVIPRLEAQRLQALASASGGRYARISADDSDLDQLLREAPLSGETRQLSDRSFDQYREEGPWLLLLLLPLAALGYRRGWLGCALCLVLLLPHRPAHALDWDALWQRPDQRAATAFSEQRFDDAAKTFVDPRWKASAQYRNGDYAGAAEQFGRGNDADSHYNRGNALARAGQLQEALQAYDAALELEPEMEDAAHNRRLVEQMLQQQASESAAEGDSPPDTGERNDQPGAGSGSDESASSGSTGEATTQPSPAQDRQRRDAGDATAQAQDAQPGRQDSSAQAEAADQAQAATEDADKPPSGERNGDESGGDLQGQTPPADLEGEDQERAFDPQVAEQLLRRVPDDPGGLLRQKFLYQYRQRPQHPSEPEQTW